MTLYLIVFLSSVLLTFFVRKIALKNQIVDIPNHRSSHTTPTPRGGGLAIAIVWYCSLVVLFIYGKVESSLFFALLSGGVLSIVSFIDDLKNLSPKIRIIAQVLSAVLAMFALGGSTTLDLGFVTWQNTYILSLLSIPFILWFINLFNFLDGIDGYLGMEAIFVFGGMWFFTSNVLLLILVFAVLGFLIWNWPIPKAKIFCGDVGSTLIGFNVAIFAIYFQNTQQLSIVFPILLSGLFWFDATLTLFRRWKNKENLSEAHRKHAYQRIVQAGFSHAKTVYLAISINLILVGVAFYISSKPSFYMYALLAVILFLWLITRLVDKKKPFEL